MNIYLLSNDYDMTAKWNEYFSGIENVEVVFDDFEHFIRQNKVDCVVSPANSFGLMDGGYDAAITSWFGDELQKSVQRYITEEYYGEQPVGTSFIIGTPIKEIWLIHTPTMRIPEKIIDISVIYHCMRSTLIVAMQNGIKNILIPAFGAATGGVSCEDVAEMMWMAYMQIIKEDKSISWESAIESHFREVYY